MTASLSYPEKDGDQVGRREASTATELHLITITVSTVYNRFMQHGLKH